MRETIFHGEKFIKHQVLYYQHKVALIAWTNLLTRKMIKHKVAVDARNYRFWVKQEASSATIYLKCSRERVMCYNMQLKSDHYIQGEDQSRFPKSSRSVFLDVSQERIPGGHTGMHSWVVSRSMIFEKWKTVKSFMKRQETNFDTMFLL